ncbi:MAG: helix-turn-helix domain-containing protein, partial [Acidimicrobiales bacterium]
VLAGCPAGLAVPARRLLIRVEPDGRRTGGEPAGAVTPMPGHEGATVWLDRSPPGDAEFDRVVLDRLAATAGIVLDRTGSSEVDPGAVELLLDVGASEAVRLAAARRLGLAMDGEFVVTVAAGARESAVARGHAPNAAEAAFGTQPPGRGDRQPWAARVGGVEVTIEPAGQSQSERGQRSATGPVVGIRELPLSYQQARIGLRLTGEPGPSHVDTAALGGLLALADGCDSPSAVAEVAGLEGVTSAYSWALATLTAVAAEASLRGAAGVVHVHHSTLQSRVELIERRLGYAVTTPAGRTRLTVALALRLLRRNR